MSANWIAVDLLPLLFVLVVVVECSRLHCARRVQRRMGNPLSLRARSSAHPHNTP